MRDNIEVLEAALRSDDWKVIKKYFEQRIEKYFKEARKGHEFYLRWKIAADYFDEVKANMKSNIESNT